MKHRFQYSGMVIPRSTLLCIVLVLACLAFRSGIEKNTLDKPNIVLVITDDQGKNDLGCEGNKHIKTPHLDQFYSEAIRLTNFHVSTTCAPTRGSIMTGRHTNRLNVFHTISGRSLLFEDEVLLPQVLAQNGYTNGMFGKWHLGDNYPFRPEDRGFHEVVCHGGGGVGQGPDYWGNDYFDDTYWHNGDVKEYQGYCTDVFFEEALEFIEDHQEEPFFCYISTNAPHGPLHCPEEYIDLYEDNPDLSDRFKRFYGMISNIDDNFNRLRTKLDDLGIADNTILIFMTDNGSAGGQNIYDAGMTGGKGSVMEGGHRVPFYLKWPDGGLSGGIDITQLTAHYDLLPTLVDLIDIRFTPVKPLDGISLVPLLKGQTENWKNRILYMDTQRLINLSKYKDYTVMDEKWRLVNGEALYDLDQDLKQEHNVINRYPEVAERLAEGYEKWWESFVDEGVNEKYAYIQVGTPYENPSRISAHDMLTGNLGRAWHQFGAIEPTPAAGRWKIEFKERGQYKFSICRFPRESRLTINQTFESSPQPRRLERPSPAGVKSDFQNAFLRVGPHRETAAIEATQSEVSYTLNMSSGKYDLEAGLIDGQGRSYPAYYLYIEKL